MRPAPKAFEETSAWEDLQSPEHRQRELQPVVRAAGRVVVGQDLLLVPVASAAPPSTAPAQSAQPPKARPREGRAALLTASTCKPDWKARRPPSLSCDRQCDGVRGRIIQLVVLGYQPRLPFRARGPYRTTPREWI